jgi:hypothetical protein
LVASRSLILPPFFTPGTLFVYPSTNKVVTEQAVPYLTIANSSEGLYYLYSPSIDEDSYNLKNVPSRVFAGPRTILTLLSTATVSRGEILRVKAPYNHSSYSVSFFGRAVQCGKADPSVESKSMSSSTPAPPIAKTSYSIICSAQQGVYQRIGMAMFELPHRSISNLGRSQSFRL